MADQIGHRPGWVYVYIVGENGRLPARLIQISQQVEQYAPLVGQSLFKLFLTRSIIHGYSSSVNNLTQRRRGAEKSKDFHSFAGALQAHAVSSKNNLTQRSRGAEAQRKAKIFIRLLALRCGRWTAVTTPHVSRFTPPY
jgi:hypothetical protein